MPTARPALTAPRWYSVDPVRVCTTIALLTLVLVVWATSPWRAWHADPANEPGRPTPAAELDAAYEELRGMEVEWDRMHGRGRVTQLTRR